ncbi:hypothetical protein INR49_022028 [Caranx melampygus]|nr:hypothetical protein INR49_022028 [Caranx melampygus]
MAEIGKGVSAGKLAINVQKRLTRAQEKVLQKLGKADETRDAAFEEMVANFNKQMTEGTKLQKDLKAYVQAVKTLHDASRRLQDCLADMYEPEWFGKEEMDTMVEEMIEKEMDNNLEDTDTLWLDFHQNITDKSLVCVDTYLNQFPEIKARIAKRDRKMVDFDSARHHFASLQKGKKKDEAKIAKAEEDLGRAQKIFEELNVELQDELPALWDNRVGVYVNTFQSLAGHQEKFHKEMSKLSQNLNDIMTKLEEQRQLKKGGTAAAKTGDGAKSEEANHSESASSAPKTYSEPNWDDNDDSANVGQGGWGAEEEEAQVEWSGWGFRLDLRGRGLETTAGSPEPRETLFLSFLFHHTPSTSSTSLTSCLLQHTTSCLLHYITSCLPSSHLLVQSSVTNGADGDLPPGFLYKVKAIHDYAATDGDELELQIGDIVLVLAFDNPDEQDDGWLMGLKESQWLQKKDISAKGVFPENFTQKI